MLVEAEVQLLGTGSRSPKMWSGMGVIEDWEVGGGGSQKVRVVP